MYASPIVLIFSRPCRAAKCVEGAEDLVEQLDDTGRLHPFGERREVDDVGEQDRHLLVGLGDHAGLALQPFRDRFREDVRRSPSDRANASSRARTANCSIR